MKVLRNGQEISITGSDAEVAALYHLVQSATPSNERESSVRDAIMKGVMRLAMDIVDQYWTDMRRTLELRDGEILQ